MLVEKSSVYSVHIIVPLPRKSVEKGSPSVLQNNEIEVSHEGPITIIRLNRPQVRNAINKATAVALYEAWMIFEADEQARVGILTGGDEVFCAGADLRDLQA